jgi:hypothetical protein
MAQTVTTIEVNKLTGDGGTATINADDFDPELHEKVEGKSRPRVRLADDAPSVEAPAAVLDSAAVKEMGARKTKAEKDALDNAKVVKEPNRPRIGGAAVGVGEDAPVENRTHKVADKDTERRRKEKLKEEGSGMGNRGSDRSTEALSDPQTTSPGNPNASGAPREQLKE